MRLKLKYKSGAASFYMVALSTLILIIIATSFAAIVISQISRSSNDDLSQSAYDSALAGVEDAKIALFNYQNCLKDSSLANCSNIIKYMEDPKYQDCDMVARMTGRIPEGEEGREVIIEESNIASNNMQQAYTCVKIDTSLKDYRSTISSTNQISVARVRFDDPDNKRIIDKITSMKISWFSNKDDSDFYYTNYDSNTNRIHYPSSSLSIKSATPPTISLSLIQTGNSFTLEDFNMTKGDATNRGTLYLTPVDDPNFSGQEGNSYAAIDNHIDKNGFLKSNDKIAKNLPYGVYCPLQQEGDFACSVTIDLPKPIGGERSNDTFMFVVSLPYDRPATDFSLEFFCNVGEECFTDVITFENENGEIITETIETNQANLKGSQIEIDSTGRANDLFRRVQVRLENMVDSSLSILGPLELLGKSNENLLRKDYLVTTEFNFD